MPQLAAHIYQKVSIASSTCQSVTQLLPCAVLCHRYAYVVPCCPRGLRRAVVLLRGRGTGPGSSAAAAEAAAAAVAAGSSGSSGGVRFACAQLSFLRAADVAAFGADECLEGWRDRVVHGF
jgi:hypothetical protein